MTAPDRSKNPEKVEEKLLIAGVQPDGTQRYFQPDDQGRFVVAGGSPAMVPKEGANDTTDNAAWRRTQIPDGAQVAHVVLGTRAAYIVPMPDNQDPAFAGYAPYPANAPLVIPLGTYTDGAGYLAYKSIGGAGIVGMTFFG